MYSDEETAPLFGISNSEPEVRRPECNSNIWKYVSVAAGLSAVGLLAVTFGGGITSSERAGILSTSRIQMAKEGSITYSKLSDNDVSDLFDEFKKKFRKEVSRNIIVI